MIRLVTTVGILLVVGPVLFALVTGRPLYGIAVFMGVLVTAVAVLTPRVNEIFRSMKR
jgi:hypothetical protein